jgi:hypothetical protein
MKSLAPADRYGYPRYVSNQTFYSLVGRDYEWELMPLERCQRRDARLSLLAPAAVRRTKTRRPFDTPAELAAPQPPAFGPAALQRDAAQAAQRRKPPQSGRPENRWKPTRSHRRLCSNGMVLMVLRCRDGE